MVAAAGDDGADTAGPAPAAGGPVRATVTVVNRLGLHARAAVKFVRTAGRFDAEVRVTKDGITVPGTSIMGLMMLAAATGSELDLEASGPEAGAAITALVELVEGGFGEG